MTKITRLNERVIFSRGIPILEEFVFILEPAICPSQMVRVLLVRDKVCADPCILYVY